MNSGPSELSLLHSGVKDGEILSLIYKETPEVDYNDLPKVI